MTTAAMLLMAGSWVLVLGLTVWSFHRVLRASGRREPPDDPDRPGGGSAEGRAGP